MGLFDWMTKDKEQEEIETKKQEQVIENIVSQEDEDARKRKLAFEKLTRGENPLEKNEQPKRQQDMLTLNETAQGSQEVAVYNIKTNQDLDIVVEYINRNEPIIANLVKVPKKEQQRVQDFLSGVVFALNAHISLLVQDMFLITPEGIEIEKKN